MTGYWQLKIDAIKIGNNVMDVCSSIQQKTKYCGAIIDSGTSFIGFPIEYFNHSMLIKKDI